MLKLKNAYLVAISQLRKKVLGSLNNSRIDAYIHRNLLSAELKS